ncbi:hypothetical protein I316_06488 [Kwoniella heveanensis BCC8398]|uniref:Uncharacterized protein n=1 Tax=Kwoniella heveanensis BCC8398 TaxID=1296120 RepID=A0A1B9GLL8_9TREE|nr:hypothetical protein I316_06488 [Kwoniella heveanensis BCC8398]
MLHNAWSVASADWVSLLAIKLQRWFLGHARDKDIRASLRESMTFLTNNQAPPSHSHRSTRNASNQLAYIQCLPPNNMPQQYNTGDKKDEKPKQQESSDDKKTAVKTSNTCTFKNCDNKSTHGTDRCGNHKRQLGLNK